MLGLSYREHKTNEYIWQLVNVLARRHEFSCQPYSVANYRWLAMSADVRDTLPKIILQGTVEGLLVS